LELAFLLSISSGKVTDRVPTRISSPLSLVGKYLQLFSGIYRSDVMFFYSSALKSDVFSWGKPRKGDVLQLF
jgi:hypothetical protein